MTNFEFYEEMNGKKSAGNVVAVDLRTADRSGNFEGFGSIYDHADSHVAWVTIAGVYLTRKTRPITEEKAREIHPNLFVRIAEDAEVTA